MNKKLRGKGSSPKVNFGASGLGELEAEGSGSDHSGRSDPTSAATSAKILYRRSDLKSIGIWLSNPQLLRLEAAGRFPRRVRLSANSVCWPKDEICDWIEKKKDDRKNHHYGNGEDR